MVSNRSCGSSRFNWSKTIISISSAPDFAVWTEAGFGRAAITQAAFEPVKKFEQNRRGRRAADGHDNPLPQRTPAQQRRSAAGQQQQQGHHRQARAGEQAEHKLGVNLVAQNPVAYT